MLLIGMKIKYTFFIEIVNPCSNFEVILIVNSLTMKKNIWILIYYLIITGAFLMLAHSCKKDKAENEPFIEVAIVRDIDGNSYKTVKIGTQEWMAENLRTTKYCNGDSIIDATMDTAWMNLSIGAYNLWPGSLEKRLGFFYNWYAANDNRKITPAGWHIPTDSDWAKLTNFLGGESVAGEKLKDWSMYHWWSGWNPGLTIEGGFSGAGCGYYGYYIILSDTLSICSTNYQWLRGYWRCSTENNSTEAWCRYVDDNHSDVFRSSLNKSTGCSIRCVKD